MHNRQVIMATVRVMAEHGVIPDADDAELMLAVREQVHTEHGFYPMLSSYDQTEIISYYWKVYDSSQA